MSSIRLEATTRRPAPVSAAAGFAWSEVIEEAFKPAQGPATPWFWPMIYGSMLGVAMGVAAPGPWFLWLPVGWSMGLALGTAFKTSGDSESSEGTEGE